MPHRTVKEAKEFKRACKKIYRKHRGLSSRVQATLNDLALDRIPDGSRFPGFDEEPVYKIRCGTGTIGTRKGARILYYKTNEALVALYIYLKSDLASVSDKFIRDILDRNMPPS